MAMATPLERHNPGYCGKAKKQPLAIGASDLTPAAVLHRRFLSTCLHVLGMEVV